MKSKRYLPTATDALVIATVNDWESINFPRKYLSGKATVYWSLGDLWFESPPASGHGAYIRNPEIDTVMIDVDVNVLDLSYDDAIVLSTNGHSLSASGTIKISTDSELIVEEGDTVAGLYLDLVASGNSIHVLPGGFLSLDKGIDAKTNDALFFIGIPYRPAKLFTPQGEIILDHALLELRDSEVWARSIHAFGGSARIQGGNSVVNELHDLVNEGDIITQNGSLQFRAKSDEVTFDLDGREKYSVVGKVLATGGSILFDAEIRDPFNGYMGNWL